MSGWVDEWVDTCVGGWMKEWVYARMKSPAGLDEGVDGWLAGCVDGWVSRWARWCVVERVHWHATPTHTHLIQSSHPPHTPPHPHPPHSIPPQPYSIHPDTGPNLTPPHLTPPILTPFHHSPPLPTPPYFTNPNPSPPQSTSPAPFDESTLYTIYLLGLQIDFYLFQRFCIGHQLQYVCRAVGRRVGSSHTDAGSSHTPPT